ncbi:hypothetical protein [Halorussus salinisoli]|uniref:hypothetical protein n=1 Tax=Halorussus salinisoli TaxID=2558242 RepID=UPI0010C1B4C3|nr:hypothetical protein [Halorussus salinisoli]
MPSTRRSLRRLAASSGGLLAVVALAGVAAAQTPGVEPSFDLRIEMRFLGALVANLLLAGALVVFGPSYARETVAELREDPVSAFLWGLLVGIGVPVLLFLLAITIVGLLVAIPGAIAFAIVGLVGNAVTIVWVGSLLVGADGRVGGKTAAVGALVLAALGAIPVLGDLITAVFGFVGLGVVGRRLYAAWQD